MPDQRNILWTELNQVNAERIRSTLGIPPVTRGVNGWLSKVIRAALKDWANELRVGAIVDRPSSIAYEHLYAVEVHVKKPWRVTDTGGKRPVLNVRFTAESEADIEVIGAALEKSKMANARARTGYNNAAIVMLALDKYAKKLELMRGME